MAGRIERWSGRSFLTACALVLALPLLHEGASNSIFAAQPPGCSALVDCDQTEDHELAASYAVAGNGILSTTRTTQAAT